jgi:Tfp pilus assembly protein PilX
MILVRILDLLQRRRPKGEDGVAMLMVLMAILVVGSLATLALGAIIAQVAPTQFQRKSLTTVNAAEAGLDAGLGAIRNAASPDAANGNVVGGDRTMLPCWNAYAGSVGVASGPPATWSTTIRYYSQDPSRQTAAWRTTNSMVCISGIGTAVVPNFALVESKGAAPALPNRAANVGNRSLETVYTFSLTNQNISGGLININGLCMDAQSAAPTAGTAVQLGTCSAGSPQQSWAFRPDFTILLTATQTNSSAVGMCLSADPTSSKISTIQTRMQSCNSSDPRQRWGIGDSREMYGRLTGVYSDPKWCLTPVGTTLVASTGGCGTAPLPDPTVGAGAAGTTAADIDGKPFQWVNFKEFGRCMDIADWVVDHSAPSGGRPSEISYPCKQDPMRDSLPATDPNYKSVQPGWNEVFTWISSSGLFYLNKASSAGQPSLPTNPKYCMKSPNLAGGYVVFDPEPTCTSTNAAYRWVVNRETGSPSSNYTIIDAFGRCLAVGNANPAYTATNGYLMSYSSIVTATCDGSAGQKWNAPPGVQDAPVDNTIENKDH